jgi:signal transduction histidine kinase/ActR/RegA family two-component response regulator
MARALKSQLVRTLPAIGLLTVVYFAIGKLALKLAFINASASPVWPPAGIALAALLVFGYRTWPGIFLGALLVNLTTTGNIATSLCIASGNTLEGVCCVWLVTRFAGGTRVFDRAQDVFKFAFAVMIATVISPTFGVTSLVLGGFANWAHFNAIWLTWWLGDATGDLVVAPLIILWSIVPSWRLQRREAVEVILLLVLLALLGETVFGGWFPISAKNYPISFICGPIVIWTAFRFAQRETATGILILSAIAIWGTLRHFGPFIMETQNQSLLILQTSTAVLAITAMALAAGMAERRHAEEAIEQQKAIVEAANKTKDNFLAMLSHELRTPLTPVLAAVDALETEPSQSEDSKAALAMIRRNVELESQLIDDLLDLTRITRDKLQLKLDPIDVHQAINNVVEICTAEAAARKLRVNLDLRAGAHHVAADAAKFQQIIWNLLKNAIKFTGENGEISISSANPAPQILAISVRDTGIGIEREIMERMFNPFEQGDRSFQRRFGGLGLGLAISKSLAQAHGGTLEAQSEGPGRGSTFTLTVKTVAPRQRATRFASTRVELPPHPLRILLVDDHQDTCSALERLLTRRGHLVAPMHNMRSAMEAGARNQFDLLISDIALPDGSGTELMTCLHAISGIRGIAISGFGMNGDIQKSLQAGFSEHLVKPVKLERLEAAIESVMRSETVSS